MMDFERIDINQFNPRIHDLFLNQWLLLTCGDWSAKEFNSMTIAWGSLGIMWNKPFAQVVVRPTRYTLRFMDKYNSFTLSAFPDQYKDALRLLGSKSGRDSDKITESGLTPISSKVGSPAYAEAELVLECKKIYWQDFDPTHFLDPDIEKKYPKKDYHRAYFGEIVEILKKNS
jgi:flavin reductase (DIM6/NTAB) family NADH-FMN oxidoreductase RutF